MDLSKSPRVWDATWCNHPYKSTDANPSTQVPPSFSMLTWWFRLTAWAGGLKSKHQLKSWTIILREKHRVDDQVYHGLQNCQPLIFVGWSSAFLTHHENQHYTAAPTLSLHQLCTYHSDTGDNHRLPWLKWFSMSLKAPPNPPNSSKFTVVCFALPWPEPELGRCVRFAHATWKIAMPHCFPFTKLFASEPFTPARCSLGKRGLNRTNVKVVYQENASNNIKWPRF